jgi:hypothetical protein
VTKREMAAIIGMADLGPALNEIAPGVAGMIEPGRGPLGEVEFYNNDPYTPIREWMQKRGVLRVSIAPVAAHRSRAQVAEQFLRDQKLLDGNG